jgi:hypothetical protein
MRQLITVQSVKDSRLGHEQRKLNDNVLKDHFTKVFQKADSGQSMTFCSESSIIHSELDNPPSGAEIRNAINQLSSNKAPGANNIPAEAFKLGGEVLVTKLEKVYKDCWPKSDTERASLFQSWREAEVITLYKGKGSRNDPNNYRGIFLLDVAGKILAKIVHFRLAGLVESSISDTQFGFRPHRSTVQSIFLLKQMQQAARYKGESLVAAFVKLTKAFDSLLDRRYGTA